MNKHFFIPYIVQKQLRIGIEGIHTMPHFVKRNSIISGIMLMPFFLAVTVNFIYNVVTQGNLYSSFLWQGLMLRIWVLYLPLIALLIAVLSYAVYLFSNLVNGSFISKLTDVIHSWPLLITGVLAFAIPFVLIFHDRGRCWLRNPVPINPYFIHSWRCTVGNSVNLNTLFKRAF